MSDQNIIKRSEEFIAYDLQILDGGKGKEAVKVIANAMSAIPWVGSFIAAGKAIYSDREQGKVNSLHEEWLRTHKKKVEDLQQDLLELTSRVERSGDPSAQERLDSENYLSLIRRAFRSWDLAETSEKRQYIVNLMSNAVTNNICPDEQIRHFNEWIDQYNEIHFLVIKAIVNQQGITRRNIWLSISGEPLPRDNSAEADLFKLVIRDLNTGGVIRQVRRTNTRGEFLKETQKKSMNSNVMESAFERTKPYELTELGRQFVHYTMNDVVIKLG